MSFINRDTWIGLVMMLVAAVYWLEADKIKISPLDGPVGASGLPKSLAYALGALSLILIGRSLVSALMTPKSASEKAADEPSLADTMRPHLRAVGMLGIGAAYLLLVSWLGYIVAIAALLLAVSLYIGAAWTFRTLLIAVGGGILYYLLFVQFLGIPLPPGKIPALLGLG
ncbi:MAG: tripartite tricarboxylate transporter TctB family protein [Pseudomonadota bacterium]